MLQIFLVTLLVLLWLYYLLKKDYNYWKKKGVPQITPRLFFGNAMETILLKSSSIEEYGRLYKEYENEPFVGLYEMNTPVLLLRDPALIKQIAVQYHSHFQGRGIAVNEKADPLSESLPVMVGPRWRLLRSKLSTLFSSGRLKEMYQIIFEEAQKFTHFAEKHADNDRAVKFDNLFIKFGISSASKCMFGIETNTLQEKEAELELMYKEMVDAPLAISLRKVIRVYMPKMFKALQLNMTPSKAAEFIVNIVKNVITYRKKYNTKQYDLIQALVEVQDTTPKKESAQEKNTVITEDSVYAQALAFFIASVSGASLLAGFAAYELAANPEIQDKLYEEIRINIEKYGSLSYEAISNMVYLDCVINELLRKYPTIGIVTRECNEAYKIPGTDVIIEEGIKVLIPIRAIHHDPRYYENPEKFNPDRFFDRNRKLRNDGIFMAFGIGPRMCIASRFISMKTKIGLATFLMDYEVAPSSKMSTPLIFKKTAAFLTTQNGIWVTIHRRRKNTGQ
ncbi:hypothetical protein KM043_014503 [Ampulex compressa]|nr:hypothetical protein KM043_014503 [Ampulex compressa]